MNLQELSDYRQKRCPVIPQPSENHNPAVIEKIHDKGGKVIPALLSEFHLVAKIVLFFR